MAAFRFRLARVLGWYRKQCQLAEDRLRAASAELTRVEESIQRLCESRIAVDRGIVDAEYVEASDLAALHGYREGSRREESALQQNRAGIKKSILERRAEVTSLRTRIRLLEKLSERREGEHIAAADRELEELAADAFRSASFHARAGTQ
ncbi:MAG TPA: hypothetical protein VG273_20635 [Bryobacteraceae bacterium]|jgi:hypothetical protein|nr:hypothetical protein [Bryobacteraceae bacterium]